MYIIANPELYKRKEELYIEVRDKEGRVITDDMLKQLPYLQPGDLHKAEWDIRAANFERFSKYLSKKFKGKQLQILDVGCGNGWMTHRLHQAGHNVLGVDLNFTELQQAERVFSTSDTLQWVYADVLINTLPHQQFDIILFSASCQYFPDIEVLTKKLKPMLVQSGEIHFTDSVFYKDAEEARLRSAKYYADKGVPEMAGYYFHHTIDELKKAGYKKLYPGLFVRSALQWWCKQ